MEFFQCKSCKQMRTRWDFYIDKRNKNGIKKTCKDCIRKHRKNRNIRNSAETVETIEKNRNDVEKNRNDVETSSQNVESKIVFKNFKKPKIETNTHYIEFDDDSDNNEPILDPMQITTRQKYPGTYPFFHIEQEWEPVKHYSMVIDASRGSGKTAFIKAHFEFWKTKYDIILFFCQNPQSEHYDWLDDSYKDKWMFLQWQPEILVILEKFQNATKNALRILIIGDDIMDRSNKYSDSLRQTYLRGRNIGVSVILAGQSPMLFDPDIRGNSDFYMSGDHYGPELKEKAIRTFLLGAVPLPEELKFKNRSAKFAWLSDWLDANTADHWFIVINYRTRKIMEYNRDWKDKL